MFRVLPLKCAVDIPAPACPYLAWKPRDSVVCCLAAVPCPYFQRCSGPSDPLSRASSCRGYAPEQRRSPGQKFFGRLRFRLVVIPLACYTSYRC